MINYRVMTLKLHFIINFNFNNIQIHKNIANAALFSVCFICDLKIEWKGGKTPREEKEGSSRKAEEEKKEEEEGRITGCGTRAVGWVAAGLKYVQTCGSLL